MTLGAIDWQVVSAIVQALSAVAVAVMTFFLVRFTGRYVAEMKVANDLQEQANSVSGALLARASREDAPFLVASAGGGSGQRDGAADVTIRVQNRGGGLAHDIKISTDKGEATLDSLGAGDSVVAQLHIDSGWDTVGPSVTEFRFKDAQGTIWVQKPNNLPEHGEGSSKR